MQILITGGAGFIGSHLAKNYIAQGHEVIVLDDLSTGRLSNLKDIEQHPKFRIVQASCLDYAAVEEAMRNTHYVYHLAAVVGVKLVHESPVRTIRTNVIGTDVVLQAAAEHGAKVFLASSSEVYGLIGNHIMREDAVLEFGRTDRPRGAYGCSKAMDEWLAFAYEKDYGLPFVIGRFFNTSGRNQSEKYGMVLPRFVRRALLNEPLRIFGNGEQARCFCHVSDAVQAIMRLMEEPSCAGRIFNIAGNQSISITQLAQRVKSVTGSSSEIQYIPYSQVYGKDAEDPQRRQPDVTSIKQSIGWSASTGLDDIIEDIVREVREKESANG
jgi:UDP-glucose 4-epimerase